MRYAWAKAEVERGNTTPALTKYVEESLKEWQTLTASIQPEDDGQVQNGSLRGEVIRPPGPDR
jgi:hypothetical protein